MPATLWDVRRHPREDASSANDGELLDLVVAYARQETIEPLRGAGRWILWGIVSMLFLSVGMVMCALGLLRAVQAVGGDTLDGGWSFVPYLFALVFSSLIVVFALTQVRRARL